MLGVLLSGLVMLILLSTAVGGQHSARRMGGPAGPPPALPRPRAGGDGALPQVLPHRGAARHRAEHAAAGQLRPHADPRLVLQKVTSEANPKVRNHGEGPY